MDSPFLRAFQLQHEDLNIIKMGREPARFVGRDVRIRAENAVELLLAIGEELPDLGVDLIFVIFF